MSLSLHTSYTVPQETARIARAVLPTSNFYIRLYDTLGTLFQDQDFAALFPKDGQTALSPVRLMLVIILQYVEGLTDRQAAEAVRTRIDWKYLLCLEITDAGFDYSVLSEFRTRLIESSWEQKVFEVLLGRIRSQGLLKAGGQQRTDATLVLGAVRDLSRLEMVGETLRSALNSLSIVAPDWMRMHYQEAWLDRYGVRVQNYRLPTSQIQRDAYAEVIGSDGLALLLSICTSQAPAWLREVPAVRRLHRVWIQNYTWREENQLRWRQADELSPGAWMLHSPYDEDVRLSKKRETLWVGYKVHLTETCDENLPRIITHVETTLATTADGQMTTPLHEALKTKELLPADHIVDTAYLDAQLLVTSQQIYAVNLVGPTRPDTAWQARQDTKGFTAFDFTVDWERHQAICPAGKTSQFWLPATGIHGNSVIQIKFAKRDCRPCSLNVHCTHAQPPRRTITVLPEEQQKALLLAREREKTKAFAKLYARRAGIEGIISQGVRTFDLRRTRNIGLAKTHLQHMLIAVAMNLVRTVHWLNEEPLARTHPSAFVRLCQAPGT